MMIIVFQREGAGFVDVDVFTEIPQNIPLTNLIVIVVWTNLLFQYLEKPALSFVIVSRTSQKWSYQVFSVKLPSIKVRVVLTNNHYMTFNLINFVNLDNYYNEHIYNPVKPKVSF